MAIADKAETLKVIIPILPTLILTAILHILGLLPTSSKWDLRTTLTVAMFRSIIDPDRNKLSISQIQASTLRDPGPSGKIWVSRTKIRALPAHQDPVPDVVFKAIKNLGDGTERYIKPYSEDMNVEWIGHRPDAREDERLPENMSEVERYEALMSEPSRKSNATTLYFHGGAYYLCGLSSHRRIFSRLAKESCGRVLAIEYRLAPKAAFPSQLIDALNAYLYLLYPPEDAFHGPVAASDIVFAGDSAGGNLAFVLLQLLLEIHRCKPEGLSEPVLRYNDKEVAVPLPAGVSACSGWFDITRSMPSVMENTDFDYLPSRAHTEVLSWLAKDHLWPSDPPRGDIFCDLSLLCHPLCSPIAAADWTGSPPVWIATGQEMLTDEDAFVAETVRRAGVCVQYEQYEAMPHCAMMLFPKLPTSRRGLESWGAFIRDCVDRRGARLEANGTLIKTTCEEQRIQGGFSRLGRVEVLEIMSAAKERRCREWKQSNA